MKLLSALLVTNSLLSVGGQDGKIPPAHEIPRNQSDYRIVIGVIFIFRSWRKMKNAITVFLYK